MSFAAETLSKGVRRVVVLQAVLTLLVAVVFAVFRGRSDFMSALYGGGVALLLTGWLGLGVLRARGLGSMYANALVRYAAAIVFLGLGMGVLNLVPLPLITAFAVTQLGFLAMVPRTQADR